MVTDPRRDAAQQYLTRGWQPLPIPERAKKPAMPNWPGFRADGNVAEYFSGSGNIGVLLGEPSGGLIDIDLDAIEAISLAQHFLPPTDSVFGRASKPRSHWLYIIEPAAKTVRFQDPTSPSSSAMLVELRSTGAQTVFPPSTHPIGERVEWHSDGEPARIDPAGLWHAVHHLAAAALLKRYYPAEGSRHDFALAISGALIRGGWSSDKIAEFLRVVADAAGDPETRDRARAGEYSAQRIASGQPATGWPTLTKLLGKQIALRLREWLQPSGGEQRTGNSDGDAGPYLVANNRITFRKETQFGPVIAPLSNVDARIAEELILDDGRDTRRAFLIQGSLAGGKPLPAVRVPVERFQAMSWPLESWGNNAVVSAGLGTKDKLREAIQLLSGEVPTRHIFCHTGWTHLNGQWVFLSANGGVGGEGVEVDLPLELRRYALPCKAENGREAMELSLRLLDLAPLAVTAPLWAGIFRAPLASAYPLDVSLFLHGPTGALKSTVAALFLDHFGDFSRTTLPGAWSSTANALEQRAFVLKDVPFVIDDFAPSPLDAREMETKASRLLRAGGNLSGRGRLRSDLTEHITHPPRGLIISTGEQVPAGQSILARTFVIPLEPDAVDLSRITELQDSAHRLPHAMSAYIEWLAQQMDPLPKLLRETFQGARTRANCDGMHLRIPEALAHLWIGAHAGLQFAEDIGAISSRNANELREKVWTTFVELGEQQSRHIEGERPTRRFLEVLATLITQGKVYLVSKGNHKDDESRADFLGWYDDDWLYLIPSASFHSVTQFCRQSDEPFAVRQVRLFRDLRREGLSECEPGRTTANVRLSSETRRVIRLRRSAVEDLLGENPPVEETRVPSVPGYRERGR
jgi:Bifunctional DNA primase/polymerase, N-terminal